MIITLKVPVISKGHSNKVQQTKRVSGSIGIIRCDAGAVYQTYKSQ